MEVTEEVIFGPKEQQSGIVKGKRTKRLRPQSPIPFAIANNSLYNDDNNNNVTKNVAVSPPSSSSSSSFRNGAAAATEEEEDMANCLILLAQGQSRVEPATVRIPLPPSPKRIEPFTSRRFLEASSAGGGKAGYYVYECKTCNRTFPSFQALGGHRASHKKPKFPAEEKRFHLSSDEEETHLGKSINNAISSLSLHLSSSNGGNYNDLRGGGGLYSSNTVMINNKGKVHECSICGAEFTSGQALGGHMRRHRGPVTAAANAINNNNNNNVTVAAACTTLSLSSAMVMESSEESKKVRNVLNLELDLNLPAPEDDHRETNKFGFASKQQDKQEQQPKSHMVFSAPALVDCHY